MPAVCAQQPLPPLRPEVLVQPMALVIIVSINYYFFYTPSPFPSITNSLSKISQPHHPAPSQFPLRLGVPYRGIHIALWPFAALGRRASRKFLGVGGGVTRLGKIIALGFLIIGNPPCLPIFYFRSILISLLPRRRRPLETLLPTESCFSPEIRSQSGDAMACEECHRNSPPPSAFRTRVGG